VVVALLFHLHLVKIPSTQSQDERIVINLFQVQVVKVIQFQVQVLVVVVVLEQVLEQVLVLGAPPIRADQHPTLVLVQHHHDHHHLPELLVVIDHYLLDLDVPYHL
jgi:hypothetical protein